MVPLKIIRCSRKDIPLFTQIMCQAFRDKYPRFFTGLLEYDYVNLVTNLNLAEFDISNDNNKYLLLVDNEKTGAMEIYWKGKKRISLGLALKILMKKISPLKALKTALMLKGFGPPFLFPKNTLFIDKVGILENHRGKGLGTKLLKFAFNFAKRKKLKNIELEVIEKNTRAISLYKKLGFKIIQTKKTILGRIFVGVSKFYLMRKTF